MGEVPGVPRVVAEMAAAEDLGGLVEVFHAVHHQGMGYETDVYAFENGCLILSGRQIQDPASYPIKWLRWTDVAFFFQRVTQVRKPTDIHMDYAYKMQFSNENEISISASTKTLHLDGSGLENFAKVIDPMITAAQMPGIENALKEGRPVDFKKFMVEPDGILVRRKKLRWAEVESINVKRGLLEIHARGKRRPWKSWMAADVPNRSAFLYLAKRNHCAVT